MSRATRLVLSVSTGILLSLAWLDLPGWILFIALVPLLLVDSFFVENKENYKSVSYWGHAFISVFLWNSITTWWIAHATVAGALLAITANSFVMSLVLWLGHIARRIYRKELAYIALIVFWISFEYLHFIWDVEWPWLNLGNGFANNIKMVQWYEYTGTLGGTLWILMVNIVSYNFIQDLRLTSTSKKIIKQGSYVLLTICVPIYFSYKIYSNYLEKENPVDIVLVQPNIDPYSEQYDSTAEEEKLNIFIQLAESQTTKNTQLIIGPETLFERWPDWNIAQLEYNNIYRKLHDWILNHPKADLIFGASTHTIYPSKESASTSARESNGTFFDVYNSAITIRQDGSTQIYHKSILVPGVEKMPFRKYLGFLNDVVFDLGGTTGSLGIQENPVNFNLKDSIQAAPVICYESVFGEYLAKFIREGAEIIVVITNDGWWRNTPGYRQHFSFSRLRAIETRRSIARVANTGISGFINQRGEISAKTEWWTPAVISGKINLNTELTFYVRHGEYIARVALFTSSLLLLLLIVKGILLNKQNITFENRG
ncbi:MAG TPA: apolipoprotein N-acyltransferase [Mariniphaga sp.]|nr:apolipoprotein N-acyltransferase [Mariniphaga sp.]